VVRALLFARLQARDLERLARLWEKEMPGSVASAIWPMQTARTRAADAALAGKPSSRRRFVHAALSVPRA